LNGADLRAGILSSNFFAALFFSISSILPLLLVLIKDVGPEGKLNTKKQFANKRKRDDEKEEEEGKTEKWKKI